MTASVWVCPEVGVDLGYVTEVGAEDEYVTVPDGRCGVVWTHEGVWWLGPAARPWRTDVSTRVVGVRLALASGRAFAGTALHPWRDQRVPLSAVCGDGEVLGLRERLAGEVEVEEQVRLLARYAATRVLQAGGVDAEVDQLTTLIGQGLSVSALAAAVGVTPRQLLRRCNDQLGMPPSTLRRILRLHRSGARHRDDADGTWASVAAAEGYADQAHLARDTRDLTLNSLRDAHAHRVRFVQATARTSP